MTLILIDWISNYFGTQKNEYEITLIFINRVSNDTNTLKSSIKRLRNFKNEYQTTLILINEESNVNSNGTRF